MSVSYVTHVPLGMCGEDMRMRQTYKHQKLPDSGCTQGCVVRQMLCPRGSKYNMALVQCGQSA